MRFIIFGLLFLSAIYFSESKSIAKRDATADLQKTIAELLTKARAAVETLQKSGKPALVNGLEKSIKFLVEVEGSLKKLNPTTDLGKALLEGLEGLVKQGEAALEADLKKAQGSFYEDAAKTELLKQADNLKSLVAKEVESLKSQGKHFLADNLLKFEKMVLDAETTLNNLNPSTEFGKILLRGAEALLKSAETKLEEEVKKLSGTFYADDAAKAELLKQAEILKKSANDLVSKLTTQGKTVLAEGVKKLEDLVKTAESTLLKLDPKTDLGKSMLKGAEAELKVLENKLDAEVKKLSGTFYADDAKAELLKQAETLKKSTSDLIAKLTGQGKTVIAQQIKKLEDFVITAEQTLLKLDPKTDFGKSLLAGAESLLKQAELKLEEEVKKLSGAFYADDAAKAELLKQAEVLKKSASALVAKLNAEGKTVLAEGITKLENFVKTAEQTLLKLDPKTELGKSLLAGAEAELKKVELKLDEEVKKLSGTFYADDAAKAELLKQAETLKKSTGDLIAKLTGQGKTVVAEGIKKLENFVITAEQTLLKLDPKTELGKSLLAGAESLLKQAELKLEEEVKKLSVSY